MPGPRNPDNIKLEDARRQFFQWHIVENRPISEVKQKMDLLSQELDKDFVAEESRWESRRRYWNSLSPTSWKLKKKDRGEDIPVPVEIRDLEIWKKGDQDIGDWRVARQLRAGNVEALQSGTTDDTQHSIKRDMGARPSETIHDWGVTNPSNNPTVGNPYAPSQNEHRSCYRPISFHDPVPDQSITDNQYYYPPVQAGSMARDMQVPQTSWGNEISVCQTCQQPCRYPLRQTVYPGYSDTTPYVGAGSEPRIDCYPYLQDTEMPMTAAGDEPSAKPHPGAWQP
ncbi:hypothetical protein MMC21_000591 [Puttea exsequens]|nr:hypothetical protein [Puttea exsequens]